MASGLSRPFFFSDSWVPPIGLFPCGGDTPRDRTPGLEVVQGNLSCLLRNHSPFQLGGREAWLCLVVGSKRPGRLTRGWPRPEHRAHAPAPASGTHPAPPGAGIGPTIQIGEETVITVDTKAAGKGKVTCTVCTPDGSEVDVDVVENEDGTFDIFYTAPQPGKYVICVRFGGEHVPNSPFQVTVRRVRDWGGVRAGTWLTAPTGLTGLDSLKLCALLCRLWLETSPLHSPHYGLSSWHHHIPTPRGASRPGYGLPCHLPACPALGDTWGWAGWVSREVLFRYLRGGTLEPATWDSFSLQFLTQAFCVSAPCRPQKGPWWGSTG